ncbi:MAG: hypothetical protein Q8P02_01440 [Candidatus Micrarchaeota archaeon]|nr:hypothetical protein [Candidatus Micrarchaeota archaeon]
MHRTLILLVFGFLLLGCVTSGPNAPPSAVPSLAVSQVPSIGASASATPSTSVYPSLGVAPSASAYDAPPYLSGSSARPTNPDRNQPFVVGVTATDEVGLKSISWTSPDSFSEQPEARSFDCGLQTTCSTSWTFKSAAEGEKTVTVYATDAAGQESPRSDFVFTVRPFDYKEPSPTPSPSVVSSVASGPVCGNAVCDDKEGYEVCPGDCPYAGFACANGVCEGGESYESCPQDCGVSDIIGTSCGDDACQPGEDADYCPADCAAIKPNCGNNVCDSWESEDSCYEDCAGVDPDAASCTYDSECGYHKACQGGKCVTVDCTNDAQCPSGKRCSGNSCVWCPMGPYGRSC